MQALTNEEMYQAILTSDASYEGLFITGVKTTGIFCRPACPAKTPLRKNVEFFRTPQDALLSGYRPCKRCKPLQPKGQPPEKVQQLLDYISLDTSDWLRDQHLRDRGLDPVQVRRWFKKNYGMTFHAYQRALRLGRAIKHISAGSNVTDAAYDSGYESLSGFEEAIKQFTGKAPRQNRETTIVYLDRILTPLGPMISGTTTEGLCLLEFHDRRMLRTQLNQLVSRLNCAFVPGTSPMQQLVSHQLGEYFSGERSTFDIPLVISGTPFQERVWNALLDVPYGETRSYLEQAENIGSPKSVRAVANANGCNRIAIVIPCHRIIGANGKLTGYGGGLWRKQWLLQHEGSSFSSRKNSSQADLFNAAS